jgi:hypothetical protein
MYAITSGLRTIRELSRSDSNGDNLILPEFAPCHETHFFFSSASQFATRVIAAFGWPGS